MTEVVGDYLEPSEIVVPWPSQANQLQKSGALMMSGGNLMVHNGTLVETVGAQTA